MARVKYLSVLGDLLRIFFWFWIQGRFV